MLLLLSMVATAQVDRNTEVVHLSGTGADDRVNWDFFCSKGRNSGRWTTIPVPSCWEQEGFGGYYYGYGSGDRLYETGLYRHSFEVPRQWKGKEIAIVFEGVMTDATVKINGVPAGPVHQGAFYEFRYDISSLVKYGRKNSLEVLVKKHSDNKSVNQAERDADYWVFGGIFRPVYLEVKPRQNIQRVAVDARADGNFSADVYLSRPGNARKLTVNILNKKDGTPVAGFETALAETVAAPFQPETLKRKTRISGRVNSPATWSPEFPNLYRAVFRLLDNDGKIIHTYTESIGFRTVEIRESDGIYVNGIKVKLKGVNRHTFHPKYGRTSSRSLSVTAVNLIKDMNMNAVRMSHYPPDKHFLQTCDSLGLFVLDELSGWQWPPYDDTAGRKLLKEMIARDVNHPSIILWDNGNEGGWNNNLNDDFAKLDIQKREVIHPWQNYGLFDTYHYFNYNYLAVDGFNKRKIFMPTEFLHGLYDGGHGAGLEDFWLRMWNDPLCGGGFLWVFADEAVERTDRNGKLDTYGNEAPDGIVGPYNEKEGSFYTIREVWSPVYFEKRYITPSFDGVFQIENRYHYTDLSQCTIQTEWVSLPGPAASPVAGDPAGDTTGHTSGSRENAADRTVSGKAAAGKTTANKDLPASGETVHKTETVKMVLAPGQKGRLQLALPENWQQMDMLRIWIIDPYGRLLNTWTWPLVRAAAKADALIGTHAGRAAYHGEGAAQKKPELLETPDKLLVKMQGLSLAFDKQSGILQEVTANGKKIPLSKGPVYVSNKKDNTGVTHSFQGNDLVIQASFKDGDEFTWTVRPNGLVDLQLAYKPDRYAGFTGVSFSFPEDEVAGMEWLGDGPYRVYKNRMKGTRFGHWQKEYNNTVTGESGYIYPEFKGYHANLYWARIKGKHSPGFTVYAHTDDVFLRMLTPTEPQKPEKAAMVYPEGDISFLQSINGIGDKFMSAETFGPQGNPAIFNAERLYEGKLLMWLTFDFNEYL